MNSPLTLIHLSDIHFHKVGPYDIDETLRNELVRDAENVTDEVGPAAAILISGDVAFSGQTGEYDVARNWLEELSVGTKSSVEKVRVIPGNHDVDRSKLKEPLLEDAHERLRSLAFDDLNIRLQKYLESDSFDTLISPLHNYNRFAAAFTFGNDGGCDIRRGRLWWQDDLPLNDGATLRVRGLHSALLSGPDDSDAEDRRKMIVGAAQVDLLREDDVAHLVMCHHPPSWLRDAEHIEPFLNARASIHLFGHKHMHESFVRDDKSFRLAAGAVHPERRQPGWQPRYNILRLSVADDPQGRGRVLQVEVRLRVWNPDEQEFQADTNRMKGTSCISHNLSLPWRKRAVAVSVVPSLPAAATAPLRTPTSGTAVASGEAVADGLQAQVPAVIESLAAASDAAPEVASIRENAMSAKRKLAYKYFTMPYTAAMQIAVNLELIREEDEQVSDKNELFRRFLRRAEEDGLLPTLWDEVTKRRNEQSSPNPFSPPSQPASA